VFTARAGPPLSTFPLRHLLRDPLDQPRRRLGDPAGSDLPPRDGLLPDAERGRQLDLGHLQPCADPLELLRRHVGKYDHWPWTVKHVLGYDRPGMTLPQRDPRAMRDEELSAWVRELIQRRAPESHTLDYKQTIQVDTRRHKLELAKDVSSFANGSGGVLLYGIPEDDAGAAPIPQPLAQCGMVITQGLPEVVENILVDTVDPPLPECHIRLVWLDDERTKAVLFVYHPTSWNRPHMTLYEDGRYYRRGNFRAVLMKEREVEALYAMRRAAATAAQEFFAKAEFGPLPKDKPAIRVGICPRFSLVRRETMRERTFSDWLDANSPGDRRGAWGPFLDGWSFVAYASGPIGGRQFDVRLFHSGALSFTFAMEGLIPHEKLRLGLVEKFLNKYVLDLANKAFELLRIAGPLTIRIWLFNVAGLMADDIDPWTGGIAGPAELAGDIVFDEEASTEELRFRRPAVIGRLQDRLASAFGLWREPR
jgi:schlafen family protein